MNCHKCGLVLEPASIIIIVEDVEDKQKKDYYHESCWIEYMKPTKIDILKDQLFLNLEIATDINTDTIQLRKDITDVVSSMLNKKYMSQWGHLFYSITRKLES